jgi:hypothetical protein
MPSYLAEYQPPKPILSLFSQCPPPLHFELNYSSWNRPLASVEPIADKPAETGATQRDGPTVLRCQQQGPWRSSTPLNFAGAHKAMGVRGWHVPGVRAMVAHDIGDVPRARRAWSCTHQGSDHKRTPSKDLQARLPESGIRAVSRHHRENGCAVLLPCQGCLLHARCTTRHGTHIGLLSSTGRNALPVSRPYSPSWRGLG